jgi:hypothetical protein
MKSLLKSLLVLAACALLVAAEPGAATRQEGVTYGEKAGPKLTLDVFHPARATNGAGVILIVSGGWASSPGAINTNYAAHFLQRGYIVFAVVHGSHPQFVRELSRPRCARASRAVEIYHLAIGPWRTHRPRDEGGQGGREG